MTEGNVGATPSPAPDPSYSGALVFWLLVFLAVAAFAPCVILPEWRAYQVVSAARQAQQHRVEVLQQAVDRERRLGEALRIDQTVIARLAQRDLSYHRLGERVIRVSQPAADDPRISLPAAGKAYMTPFTPEPVQPPPIVARWLAHLPDYDYDRVFCDDESRPIVMSMSVALLVTAFGLFGRRQTFCGTDRGL